MEFNENIGYFDKFQGFKKPTPYGGARKLRLTDPQCAVPSTHRSFLIANKNSYRYGSLVGRYPWYFAIGCIIFSGFCGIGLINFTEENNAFRLWIPQDSSFAKNYGWLQENFPPDSRPVPD